MDEKEIMPVPFEQALSIEETDIQTALVSYKYLAGQKEIDAIQKLFLLYYEGKLVSQDYKEALYWLKVGANLDDEVCLFHLGYFYQNGTFVPADEMDAPAGFGANRHQIGTGPVQCTDPVQKAWDRPSGY